MYISILLFSFLAQQLNKNVYTYLAYHAYHAYHAYMNVKGIVFKKYHGGICASGNVLS